MPDEIPKKEINFQKLFAKLNFFISNIDYFFY